MPLSLSCRIAEGFLSKEEASLSLIQFADLAVAAGYDGVCIRASQLGVHSSAESIRSAKSVLNERKLKVTMITGDFNIAYNNDAGPECLRNIDPYLDLAESLGAPMIRVCLKTNEDIAAARAAADRAAQRSLQLVHQCHVQSLFETVPEIARQLQSINRPNFGLIFEAANLQQCDQGYGPSVILELAPWIRNVYLQNQRIHPNGAVTLQTWCAGPVTFDICGVADPGGIDFAAVFDGLRRIDYQGPITVHESAPADASRTPQDAAARTAEYLKALWLRSD